MEIALAVLVVISIVGLLFYAMRQGNAVRFDVTVFGSALRFEAKRQREQRRKH